MNKVLYIIFISLFSLTVFSCSSSDDGASTTTDDTTTTSTTALVWDQGSWDSQNWQ
ncbi:MAG: hypothetical protein HN472_09210 [Nitrospina sp.]|nr:hypothetical protein [Nitrospina sp.]